MYWHQLYKCTHVFAQSILTKMANRSYQIQDSGEPWDPAWIPNVFPRLFDSQQGVEESYELWRDSEAVVFTKIQRFEDNYFHRQPDLALIVSLECKCAFLMFNCSQTLKSNAQAKLASRNAERVLTALTKKLGAHILRRLCFTTKALTHCFLF